MTNKIYNWVVKYMPTIWLAAMASLPLVSKAANEPGPYGALYCEADDIPGNLPIVTNTVEMVSNAVTTAVSDHVSLSTNNVLTVGNRSVAIPPRTKTVDGREYSVVYGNELAGYATSEELNTLSTNLVEDIEDLADALTSATNDLSTTFGSLVETTSNSVMTAISDSTNEVMQTVGTATNELKRAIGDTGKTILNDIAPEFNTNTVYAAGDIVSYDGKVYYCISGAEAGEWDSADFRETSIVEVLGGALLQDGVSWWEDVVEPNNYAKSSDPIIFTPSEVGFSEGDKIKAVTIIASSSYYFTPSSYALRLMDDQGTMLGNTDIVYVRNPGEEYTFTFPTPISLNPTNSYQLGFYDSPTSSNPVEVQLWIHLYNTNDNPNESLNLYWHQTIWRPALKVARVSPSQVRSYKEEIGMINDKLDALDGAEPNVIEVVQVNGSALSVSNKTVNVIVPEKATSTPVIAGVASIGGSDKYAAENHVHPAETEVKDGDGQAYKRTLPIDCFPITYTYGGTNYTISADNGNAGINISGGLTDEFGLADTVNSAQNYGRPIALFGWQEEAANYNKFVSAYTGITDLKFNGKDPTADTWPALSTDSAVIVRDLQVAKAKDISAAPVQSVNGKTGAVTLTASDVGALGNSGDQTLIGKLKVVGDSSVNVQIGSDAGPFHLIIDGYGQFTLVDQYGNSKQTFLPVANGELALVSQIYAAVQQIAPAWVSGTTYAADAKVSYNGVVYARKTSGSITSSTNPESDTTNWRAKKVSELFLPLTGGTLKPGTLTLEDFTGYKRVLHCSGTGGDFYIDTYNNEGTLLSSISVPWIYGNDTLALVSQVIAAVEQIAPAWVSGTTYAATALVSYNGVVYARKTSGSITSSTDPASDATNWEAKKVSELFLPLTGGTMTGQLVTSATSNGLRIMGNHAFIVISDDPTEDDVVITRGKQYFSEEKIRFPIGISGTLALLQNLAPEYDTNTTYTVEQLVVKDQTLKRCTTAGTGPAAVFADATVQDILSTLFAALNNKLDSKAAAPDFDSATTYESGDYITYLGKLYVCTNAVTTAGPWTGSSNWEESDMTSPDATLDITAEGELRVVDASGTQLWIQGYNLATNAVTNGVLNLSNESVNYVELASSASADATISLSFPDRITGKVSDFVLDAANKNTTSILTLALDQTKFGTDFEVVIESGSTLTSLLTIAPGEMAELRFTLSQFAVNGLPTYKLVKQVFVSAPAGSGS